MFRDKNKSASRENRQPHQLSVSAPRAPAARNDCQWLLQISFFTIFSLCLIPHCSSAQTAPATTAEWKSVKQLYHGLQENPTAKLQQRLDYFSESMIGKPYILYALGEGEQAKFDQNPRFRLDGFDCETFVTTVIALSLSKTPDQILDKMDEIRYRNAEISFLNRHHFTDLDWNRNNQNAGIVRDITRRIHDNNQRSIFKTARTTINRAGWIKKIAADRVYLINADSSEKQRQIKNLIEAGSIFAPTTSEIPYLPLAALFDDDQQPIGEIWQQIPDGAIIEIVRPDWPLNKIIGTNLNVSHLGFAFWHDDTLWFRHASTKTGKVHKEPLVDYLRQALESPTIKGINVQIVLDDAYDSSVLPVSRSLAVSREGSEPVQFKKNI